MTNTDTSLNSTFDLVPVYGVPESLPMPIESSDDTLSDDIELSRTNLKSLMESGKDALENLLAVAKQSENTDSYEVFSILLKTLGDLNHQLIDVHKKKQSISMQKTGKLPNQPNKSTNNAIFVGSTNELYQMLKTMKD